MLKTTKSAVLEKINLRGLSQVNFIPKHLPAISQDVNLLKEFIGESKQLLILTGAGISTESGIPDYRSEDVGLYARTNHKPIQFQEFIKQPLMRKRYWARNFVGWDRFSQSKPNTTHYLLKNLEDKQLLINTVTQNVDGLHYKAGSKLVTELHGSAYRVHCLQCPFRMPRVELQKELLNLNKFTSLEVSTMIRPDGDVDIPQEFIDNFQMYKCPKCESDLKPDIVFFGDNVPKTVVEKVKNLVTQSDSLLVLGSSLTVFSSYRIVLQAKETNKNICIVNIGNTRGDSLADIKISAKCSEILSKSLE